jgi:hypothetical protein
MATFPISEAEVAQLARTMIGGFENHTDKLPSPPLAPDQLKDSLEAYRSARTRAKDASAAARLATAKKRETLKKLVDDMKTNLRYAENTCGSDRATLKTLGWGVRRPKKSMEVPGQVMGHEIFKEGPGWIKLRWRKPLDGGEVRAYRVERCRLDSEQWEIAGMSTATHAKLENQERGVHWMYRVIAVNAVGEGMESALAEAVL